MVGVLHVGTSSRDVFQAMLDGECGGDPAAIVAAKGLTQITDTGEIEAVRTRWWRAFDFAWGLHIMDLSEREDTSHPVLIGFAALSLVGALIGCVLMFRRRRARPTATLPAA